jgi:hypothetical protein
MLVPVLVLRGLPLLPDQIAALVVVELVH